MAEKNLTTRIKHKTDTSANWAKAVNFIPLKGEIIIYSDLRKIKVGDGTTKVNSLPFLADSDTHQAVVDKNPTLSWGTKSTVATIGGTGINVTMPANPNTHQSIKTLKTDNTAAQATSASETIAGSGTINLHKIAKTGSYNDLNNKPTIPAAANNGLLTIQRNGANVATFHANQSGDTLANISVPTELSQLGGRTFSNITSRGEEYLEWGGPAKVGDVNPIGMAISSEHSANRIAFINPAALKVEYSSDGGSTWTDYPITGDGTEQKTRLCTKNANYRIGRPDNSTNLIANKSKTRITITGQDGTNQYVYSALKKMLSGQRNLNICLMFSQISFKLLRQSFMVISPDSTLERSRISLMRASSRLLLLSTISKNFIRSSGESVSAMTLENPSIALRGVRIS